MSLVAATQDTDTIMTYIVRVAISLGNSRDQVSAKEEELKKAAYWAWDNSPSTSDDLEVLKDALTGMGLGPTTVTTTAAPGDATTPKGGGSGGGTSGGGSGGGSDDKDDDSGGGFPVWAIILICIV